MDASVNLEAEEIPEEETGPADMELVLKAQRGDVLAFEELV